MRAVIVYSRDRRSTELLREVLGRKGENKQIRFCPDVAFVLDSVKPKEVDIEPPLESNSSSPLIGLNISSLLYMGGFKRNNTFDLKLDYKQFVPVVLKNLLEKTTAHVLLVPHVFSSNVEGDELKVCSEIRDSMSTKYADRLHLVTSKYDQSQVKGIIGLCDFFVGARMHSCIAAMSQCIPTVGMAYSGKFVGVFETVGMAEWVVDMRQTEQEESIKTILVAFEKRQATAAHLRSVIPAVKEQILNTFNDIL
jgi:polysaccharide pyruvyl transferase WcaK-like protein